MVSLTNERALEMAKSQGNTPITPLIEAGCTHIIVSHLDHGSLWHRYDYPDVNILEIRPNQNLDLSFSKLLDFSRENIEILRTQGYIDAKKEISKVFQILSMFHDTKKNNDLLKNSLDSLHKTENQLDDIMNRF